MNELTGVRKKLLEKLSETEHGFMITVFSEREAKAIVELIEEKEKRDDVLKGFKFARGGIALKPNIRDDDTVDRQEKEKVVKVIKSRVNNMDIDHHTMVDKEEEPWSNNGFNEITHT